MTFVNPTNYPLINVPEELAQPFHIDPYGAVATAQDPNAAVEWRILSLLLTTPGERVMRSSYGVGLFGDVFENDDVVANALRQADVNTQIGLYEPSVTVKVALVERDPNSVSQVNVSLSYTVNSTQQSYKSVITANGQVVETQ